MTKETAIDLVLCYEVTKGQSAWEMVQDGYDGDIQAYINDYRGDYIAEETETGYIITNTVNGIQYKEHDGFISDVR